MQGEGDDRLWAAVADPGRRHILDLLLARPGVTATALAEHLPFTRQAVSKHLAVLAEAGLVAGRREGREVRWTVEPERMQAAAGAMATAAAAWGRRLRAIKQLAEAVAHEEAQRRKGSPT